MTSNNQSILYIPRQLVTTNRRPASYILWARNDVSMFLCLLEEYHNQFTWLLYLKSYISRNDSHYQPVYCHTSLVLHSTWLQLHLKSYRNNSHYQPAYCHTSLVLHSSQEDVYIGFSCTSQELYYFLANPLSVSILDDMSAQQFIAILIGKVSPVRGSKS